MSVYPMYPIITASLTTLHVRKVCVWREEGVEKMRRIEEKIGIEYIRKSTKKGA